MKNQKLQKYHSPIYKTHFKEQVRFKRFVEADDPNLLDSMKQMIIQKFMTSKFAVDLTKDLTNELLKKIEINVSFKD